MNEFEALLDDLELWLITESSCRTQGAEAQTVFAHDKAVSARKSLTEYVQKLLTLEPMGDPCVGNSRDTGVW